MIVVDGWTVLRVVALLGASIAVVGWCLDHLAGPNGLASDAELWRRRWHLCADGGLCLYAVAHLWRGALR